MSRYVLMVVMLALLMAGCKFQRKDQTGDLSLQQADSLIAARDAYRMSFTDFRQFVDSLKQRSEAASQVSKDYFYYSVMYSYNLNHSLRIPYEGFTLKPDYARLAKGAVFNNNELLKNAEYRKFLERYLDLTAKYLIEDGKAPGFTDNLFINTQFYIADKRLTGSVRQYALSKIMLLQINTFGIDNIGDMYRKFKNECTDKTLLRNVEQAYQQQAGVYRPAEKLTYKVIGQDSLNAYVTYPEKKEDLMPVIVLVHEGGWYNGQPGENAALADLFNGLGFVAVSVEYRLKARQNATPADGLRDVKSAIRWVRAKAGFFNIDPHHVMAGGVSAGGHLVAAAALIPGYEQPDEDTTISTVPDAVVLWSGCVDPTLDAWFGYCLRGTDDPANLSPTHHVIAGAPPFLIFQGTSDEFLDYHTHIDFQKKLEAQNDYCKLVIYKGKTHFQVLEQDMKPEIEAFISRKW